MSQSAFRAWAGRCHRMMMATSTSSLSIFDDEKDSDDSEEESQSECFVEMNTYDPSRATFLQVVIDCKEEAIVKTASRSSAILELLEGLHGNTEGKECKELSEKLSKTMLECVSGTCGKKIALSQVWRNFHIHRLSPSLRFAWQSCIHTLQLSQDAFNVTDPTLQLILKRLMHAVVKQMTTSSSTSIRCTPQPLNSREENAVRYMAGYVVVKLRKKYCEHSLYAGVSETMKTNLDESAVVSLDDYTRAWVEQVDRGGLCHVNDEFFSLAKNIELVCREYLDRRSQPTENILSKIEEDALKTESITTLWDARKA